MLNKFSKNTQDNLKRIFECKPREFKLSMSNIGKPLCQLEFEVLGYDKGSDPVRGSYGYLVEELLMFLIHASGLKVISEQERVSIEIAGQEINGVLDLVLDLDDGYYTVWDIKSSSSWAFKNKFMAFDKLLEEDTFGYVTQLCLYTIAKQLQYYKLLQSVSMDSKTNLKKGNLDKPIKIGGFCAFDKSSGEIRVIEFLGDQSETFKRTIAYCTKQIQRISEIRRQQSIISEGIIESKPIPLFLPIEETFRKKKTGNKYLQKVCEFCPHKFNCWDNLQLKPAIKSESKNATLRYYTEINNVLG